MAVYAFNYVAKDISYTKPGTETPINVETALNDLRQRCCDLLHNGDRFVDYSNLNQSLLVEKSEQSAGIQIADYAAGIFNSVAKKYILEKNCKLV